MENNIENKTENNIEKTNYEKYRAYQVNYALKKNYEKRHCEKCNKDISYYAYNRHLKTKNHIKNI